MEIKGRLVYLNCLGVEGASSIKVDDIRATPHAIGVAEFSTTLEVKHGDRLVKDREIHEVRA